MHNWRLLSLLNVDYKIATKAIARRLEKVYVLPEIINEDQTGYVIKRTPVSPSVCFVHGDSREEYKTRQ